MVEMSKCVDIVAGGVGYQRWPHEHSPRPQESVATRYSVGGQEPMAAGRCASCGLSIMFRDGRWRQSVGGVA